MKQPKIKIFGRTGSKASYCLSLTLLLTAIPGGYALAAGDGELQAMKQYASTNLVEILNNIPQGEEDNYGFKNRNELRQANLGLPYQEYDMDKEQPTGYWRLPVMVDGENRTLLRLKNTAEGWTFSGLGGTDLARNLEDHENNMHIQGENLRSGRIVRDFSMRCDYVQFNQQLDSKLSGSVYPLQSASEFISSFRGGNGATVAEYANYDITAIKKMRLKAQEMMGNPNYFGNSDLGN
jgi:hypothetical protein